MLLADDVLVDLLRRGERARLRGSTRAPQTAFLDPDSAYWRQGYDQRQHCHLRLAAAERSGAVRLTWSRQGGEDRPLERVRLLDVDKLADFIGAATVSASVRDRAVHAGALARHRATSGRIAPSLERIEDTARARSRQRWRLRPCTACAGSAAARRRGPDRPRPQPPAVPGQQADRSIVAPHRSAHTASRWMPPARQPAEVFAALGLVKEPQPLLVAGTGTLVLQPHQRCPIVWPFVGVSNRHVAGYAGSPAWVLSIENLTTFHLASQHPDAAVGPDPLHWRHALPELVPCLRPLLEAVPATTAVYHWGDIDQGGFRIAARIGNICVLKQGLSSLADGCHAARRSSLSRHDRRRARQHGAIRAAGWLACALPVHAGAHDRARGHRSSTAGLHSFAPIVGMGSKGPLL